MVVMERDEIRKNLIDLKLQIDRMEELTISAMSTIYLLEDQIQDEDDLAYAMRYGFLAGADNVG